jgi:hypothetical protein
MPEVTELYPSDLKPVRIGWYEHLCFDAGWVYDWRIWWDGEVWRDQPDGWALSNQDISWRGLKEKAE